MVVSNLLVIQCIANQVTPIMITNNYDKLLLLGGCPCSLGVVPVTREMSLSLRGCPWSLDKLQIIIIVVVNYLT